MSSPDPRARKGIGRGVSILDSVKYGTMSGKTAWHVAKFAYILVMKQHILSAGTI